MAQANLLVFQLLFQIFHLNANGEYLDCWNCYFMVCNFFHVMGFRLFIKKNMSLLFWFLKCFLTFENISLIYLTLNYLASRVLVT